MVAMEKLGLPRSSSGRSGLLSTASATCSEEEEEEAEVSDGEFENEESEYAAAGRESSGNISSKYPTPGDDMYDAVIKCAFGGVKMEVAKGLLTVHPAFMVAQALMLFWIQSALLLYLRLNQDLTKGVHYVKGEEDVPGYEVLPMAKCLMIAVLNLALLYELVSALRMLIFALNPATWIDVERPNFLTLGWAWRGYLLAPLATIGALLKAQIAYFVLNDSVSVVLVCDSVQDAIFNGLALTFVAELDEVAWLVSRTVFKLETVEGEDFKFKTLNPTAREEANRRAKIFPIRKDSCWRSQRRELEDLLANSILIFIYIRQLLLTGNALRTDKLPVARDMCLIWRTSSEDSIWGSMLRAMLHSMSLNVNPTLILDKACDPAHEGYCVGDSYHTTGLTDMMAVVEEYPREMILGMLVIVSVLFIPRMLSFAASRFNWRSLAPHEESAQ